jgi:penicillin-binding protein 2
MRSWQPPEDTINLRLEQRPRDLRARLGAFAAIMFIAFAVIVGRLWTLQIVHGEEYAELALHNHLKEREIPAPRGDIFDAHGIRIAEVRASFDLVVNPRDVDRAPEVPAELAFGARAGPSERLSPLWEMESRTDILTLAERLAPLLDATAPEELVDRFEEAPSRWRPVVLRSDLSQAELERLLAHRPELPGVRVVSRHKRSYPDGPLFAHLLGYMREVRADELERLRETYRDTPVGEDWYESGDNMGKYGLEAAYESRLRGIDGTYWVQVDVHGRELGRSTGPEMPGDEYFRSIAHFLDQALVPEVPGNHLHLTVRRDLQELAFGLLGDRAGAVVMMEVDTGRVLALVNAPAFDPEIFSSRISPEQWEALSTDPSHPMVDKALQGIYPPGSTWKMLVAAAVLGTETWTSARTVTCGGYLKVGRRRFHCWNRRGHGTVNMRAALKGSCDVYFYRAGLAVGIDEVARYARMFGMGEPTGIGINSESGALVPTKAWKKRRFAGQRGMTAFTAGDTASAVIGQGFTLATPMQLARMTAVIANGGTVHRPLLVDRVVGPDGQVLERGEPEVLGHVDLAPEHFDTIREGMYAVVNEIGGTGRRSRIKYLPYGGKTGTAQVVRLGMSKGKDGKDFRDHAWFMAFAPFDHPEVAISVLVEHGEHGSTAAAPIARQLLEHYFHDRLEAAKAEDEAKKKKKKPTRSTTAVQPIEDEGGGGGLDSVPGLSPDEL